jgi:exopolysaccharide biosynthesis polyprenyl glycosylphosphotransferase
MVLAFLVRNEIGEGPASLADSLVVGVLSLPVWVIAFSRHRLYSARHLVRRAEELRRVGRAIVLALVGMAALGFLLGVPASRGWLGLTGGTAAVLFTAEREVARRAFARLRRRGSLLRPVVIVGANQEARELAALITSDRALGYRVAGFVTDLAVDGVHPEVAPRVLGTVPETGRVVREVGAVGVIVAATATTLDASNRLVRELTNGGIHVELSSALRDVAPERLTLRPFGRFPLVYVEPVRRAGWRSVAKRSFDVAVALCALAVATPLLAMSAVAILVDSRGPVLFRQERVGQDGKVFRVLKLRTMVQDAEARLVDLLPRNEADGPLFKMVHDPRVTRVGRWLRSTSIDELPQLWNVVRGEMSLVGPRPALVSEVAAWRPELHERLRVKPGITGMWQVNGRSTSLFEDYVRLDLYYVDNWSLSTDLTILAKTIPAVLTRHGAC